MAGCIFVGLGSASHKVIENTEGLESTEAGRTSNIERSTSNFEQANGER